jgi:hypothetical protein
MIKKKKNTGIEVDLTGPEGNAFNLIGLADLLSKKLNLNGEKIKKEMMADDFENLVNVFDSYFGTIVTLYR